VQGRPAASRRPAGGRSANLSASGSLEPPLRLRLGACATLSDMIDILRDIAPAVLTAASAAVFAAMLWAGSRIH
jgi:hypothetical protein